MNTSPATLLSKPADSSKIPFGTLAYFRARIKYRIFSLIIKEFKKSGLLKADLARRLGDKDPAQVTRLLSGPGNLTLETVSNLLFAISGSEMDVATADPFAKRSALISELVADIKGAPIPLSQTQQLTSNDKGEMPLIIDEIMHKVRSASVLAMPKLAA